MLKKLHLLLLLIGTSVISTAQVGQGEIKGKVTDETTGEPIPFANVILENNGSQVKGTSSDFDGSYTLKPVTPGKYTLKVSEVEHRPITIEGIVVNAEKITYQNIKMPIMTVELEGAKVIGWSRPLIAPGEGNITTISTEEIQKLPGRGIGSFIGVSSNVGAGGSISGARGDASVYYLNGIKMRGAPNIPKGALQEVNLFAGGLSAKYGDVTGGVISVTTKNASNVFFGSAEYVTSGVKLGDKLYGLDAQGYNLLEFSLTGPLIMKKDSAKNKTTPLLGFFLAGNLSSVVDNNPSHDGMWKVKDDVRDSLINNPLRFATFGTGTFLNAEYLRLNDLEKIKTNLNIAGKGINLVGNVDVKTTDNINLTFGGNFAHNSRYNYSYENTLMNWENNSQSLSTSWNAYGRFTQNFVSDTSNILKNVFYSIQIDYSHSYGKAWDDTHKENLFNYGYIGEFKTYQENDYAFGQDSITKQWGMIHQTFLDTLVSFRPDSSNPEGAKITQRFYELNGWKGFDSDGNPIYDKQLAGDKFRNLVNIEEGGALLNGGDPQSIYGLWANPAKQSTVSDRSNNTYEKSSGDQFRISATGSADIKNHAISVGFEYEQRADRSYGVNAIGLWTLARLYTNNHILNLDRNNPYIEDWGTLKRFTYQRQNSAPDSVNGGNFTGDDPQYFFDYNLRKHLGLNPDGIDWIDLNAYDPETFSIDFFSADELLNQGNSMVSFFGYDHHGNKLKKDPTFDDFFTEKDEYGNYTRGVAPFRPIYIAGYIQDKFDFDDLKFTIGLRIDRFDANQMVLKDPYILFPTIKAGEEDALKLTENGSHPLTIDDDFAVYVDDIKSPTKIVGYRGGSRWYNAEGAEIDDPEILKTATGIAPLLVDKENTSSQNITSASFEDYKPQTTYNPRISFSFPVSRDEFNPASFFAHYDVLTKRPTSGLRLDPLSYYFIESNSGNTINNPNLKPEKTIDYALGFQQVLSPKSSIKITAFYREMRDMVQVVNIPEAFPKEYNTFGNIDFGTVKGLTIDYDLRRYQSNVWMKVSYTLQFADGTGSDASSASALIRAGKPNLKTTTPLNYDQRNRLVVTVDYRYGKEKDYNGPRINGKPILANTGVNIVFNTVSGRPYSKQKFASGSSKVLDGQPYGSRLPWQFGMNTGIDKDIELKWGKGEDKDRKKANLNVYVQIFNVLNLKNVVNVYGTTGNPDDDGYLSLAAVQSLIEGQTNEQSYRELYGIFINNPDNYNAPRSIQIGAALSF